MTNLLKHIESLTVVVFLLLFSGCISEEQSGGEIDMPDKVQIELFTRVYDYNKPVARAGSADETVDKEPYILVFKKGGGTDYDFVEAVKSYTVNSGTKTYVVLNRQTVECKLLILANPQTNFYTSKTSYEEFNEENLTSLLENKTLEQACAMLFTEPLGSVEQAIPFTPDKRIPSSMVVTISGIDTNTTIQAQLTRPVAKVVLESTADDFSLIGIVEVNNVPRQGLWYNLSNTVTTTDFLTNYRAATEGDIIAAAEANSTDSNPVYIYESDKENHPDTPPYIIIKGTYLGVDYYYKMAIVNTSGNPMNLLRNFKYTFIIKSVRGPGYKTVADAKISKASNTDLDYTLTIEDDSYEVIANNEYYLGVTNSLFIVCFDGSTDQDNGNGYYDNYETRFSAVTLVTNCAVNFSNSKTISLWRDWEWENVNFFLTKPNNDIVWDNTNSIELPTVTSSSTNPVVTSVNIMMPQWMSNGELTEHILFKLGNLEKKVYVRRRSSVDVGGETITIMPSWGWSTETGWDDVDHFNSGVVDEDAKSWIKLRPKDDNDIVNYNTKVTDRISVDNGKIGIEVTENTTGLQRIGTVWLTVINSGFDVIDNMQSFRIKVTIVQKAT